MCHNLIRSIILGNMPQSHRIVTHQVETKFWKKKKSVGMLSISPVCRLKITVWPFLREKSKRRGISSMSLLLIE